MVPSKEEIARLVRGALGEVKANVVITGGKLVNVYSGEILEGMEIAVLDGRICYVGPDAKHTRGSETRQLDARGLYVAPGFIDAHTHIGHFCRPYEHLQACVCHGTTSLMASCDELASVFGFDGVKLFLDEVAAHPVRVYTLISMVVPQDPVLCSTRSYSQSEIAEGLADPRVLGLGEVVSWLRLTQGDAELLERIEMALRRKKIIHGHTSGARDEKLCAIAAAGISSCHESIREQDALERLRLGYWLMLREGTFRRDLEATLKPIVEKGLSTGRVMLVTDGMAPDDVAQDGHIDFVARRAVSLGLPAMQAIQAVTLNPAIYSGLEQEIGGIAPGRLADINLLEDLQSLRVQSTLVGGEEVAREGQSLIRATPFALPDYTIKALRIGREVSRKDFEIPCSRPNAKVRVMELLNLNITTERILQLHASDGHLHADPGRDLLKVAVFERHQPNGGVALGFVKGFGAKIGAVGTTPTLDENTLLVAGSNDEDMAVCAKSLITCGGGMAVVDHGQIVEKVEFPFGGVCSLRPWQEIGKELSRFHRCLRERGAPFDKPIYALCFLTFVTLPSLRITARGLVNAKERKLVSLFADE